MNESQLSNNIQGTLGGERKQRLYHVSYLIWYLDSSQFDTHDSYVQVPINEVDGHPINKPMSLFDLEYIKKEIYLRKHCTDSNTTFICFQEVNE